VKYLIMTGRRSSIENGSTSLTIDGEKIARVASMKYLGVEIDEKLNFKPSWFNWKNTTKTHQNCQGPSIAY
jgi:hypothetical protein